jgi:adenylate kinase family enzyme
MHRRTTWCLRQAGRPCVIVVCGSLLSLSRGTGRRCLCPARTQAPGRWQQAPQTIGSTTMRINILGASGTGVTTMGKQLADTLEIIYIDSDNYFWEQTDPPFTLRRNSQERNQMIRDKLSTNTDWILGGSIINWGGNVFPDFDLVVFLYLPHDIRLYRLKKRELERYGDIIHTNPTRKEQFDKFISWAVDYDNNSGIANRTLHAHENWLQKVKSPILRLLGDLTTQERIKMTIDELNVLKLDNHK